MRAAANSSGIDLRRLLLLDAAIDFALARIPVLPSHWPVETGAATDCLTGLACSCGEPNCPTPARHVIGGMSVAEVTTDPARVARWWVGELQAANVASVAGVAFGVVELRYSARPSEIRAWLEAGQVEPGPVLDSGIGRAQFLTTVGAPEPRFAPLGSTGGVRRLGHGSIVLLPPSHHTDRHQVAWLQGPHRVALPDPDQLFDALARLPVDSLDLATWAGHRADVA
jgi:hypothetical protein